MNYKKIYDDLVTKVKLENRIKIKDGNYYERHHVTPKCLGGNNSKDNLVLLTAREHFLAHKLLVEIYPDHKGLNNALWMMVNKAANRSTDRGYRVSAKEYERAKINQSNILSARKGELHPNYGKRGPEATFYGHHHTAECMLERTASVKGKYTGENSSWYNRKHTEEELEKMRIGNKGKKRTQEVKDKMKLNRPDHKGVKNPNFGPKDDPTLYKYKRGEDSFHSQHKGKLSPIFGLVRSEETKQKLRKPKTKEHIDKIVKAKEGRFKGENSYWFGIKGKDHPSTGLKRSPETRMKQSKSLKGKPKPKIICIHCGLEGMITNINRWHNDNCKFKTAS